MPNQSYSGTVTRKSNGSIEFTPSDAGVFNKLPAMGDEVTVSIEVTRTATDVERATADAKAARIASAEADVVPVSSGGAERRKR
jgi:hypothetical protein